MAQFAVQEVVKPMNLATVKGVEAFKAAYYECSEDFYERHCNLRDHLKSLKKSPLHYNNMPIYTANEGVVAVKGRVLYALTNRPDTASDLHLKHITDEVPCGVIISDCDKRLSGNEGWRLLALLNADESDNSVAGRMEEYQPIVDSFYGSELPLVSFLCLGMFYAGKNAQEGRENAIKAIDRGNLKLLDYTAETRIPLKANEKRLITKVDGEKKLKPPQPGFTRVGNDWHRSGNCLFHDIKKDRYLIFGQDEGSYFGCQLPHAVKTVDEAFDALMPEQVRGKSFQRQGEWFALEVDPKDVPKTADCVLQFESSDYRYEAPVYLPLDTPESNLHRLNAKEGRVGKDGRIYIRDGAVVHDEHADLDLKGWWTFYRNTAVVSYSQQGVD